MEVRNDMPEEIKNQTVDGKPRVITEKIPEKFVKKIQETQQKKQMLLNQILQLTLKILNAQATQRELSERLQASKNSITGVLDTAFQKMKLGKKKNYHWRLAPDGQSFIGVYNPPKPKIPPKETIKGADINKPTLPPKNPVRPSDKQ